MSPGNTAQKGDGPETAGRSLRADAQRNRARILAAAGSVFAIEGTGVHVETIAEKAGVGVGTLYRHFPTKQNLCEAVLLERVSALVVEAQQLAAADDAGGAFFAFLAHFVGEAAAKRDLVAMMGDGTGIKQTPTVQLELADAVEVLLQRAQLAAAVRPDVSATTVLSLVGAACQAAAHTSAVLNELLAIICDGLRPPTPA